MRNIRSHAPVHRVTIENNVLDTKTMNVDRILSHLKNDSANPRTLSLNLLHSHILLTTLFILFI